MENNIDWKLVKLILRETCTDYIDIFKLVEDADKFTKSRQGRLFVDEYLMKKYKRKLKEDYPFINDRQCDIVEGQECEFPFCECVGGTTSTQRIPLDRDEEYATRYDRFVRQSEQNYRELKDLLATDPLMTRDDLSFDDD